MGNSPKGEGTMTEKQLRVKGAELDAKEQAVCVEIAALREKLTALETKRERIRMDRQIVYISYIKASK